MSPVTVLGKNPLTLVSSVLSTELFGICSVAAVVFCGSILSSGGQSVLLLIVVVTLHRRASVTPPSLP